MGGHAVFAGLPLLAEEPALGEVLVEVVGKVHAKVGEDVLEEVVGHNFSSFGLLVILYFCGIV